MFIFTVIAFFFVAQITAYKTNKKLADTLPLIVCGFILVLYLFSYFRILSLADYLGIPIIILGIFWLWRNGLAKDVLKVFFSIQNICLILFMVLIVVSQTSRVVTDLETFNYWIVDTKALWSFDGLAERYVHCASETEYMPPSLKLLSCFFVQMNGEEFSEGLAFAGYILLNYILTLPLISRLENTVETKVSVVSEEDDNIELGVSKNRKYHISDKHLVSKYKVNIVGNTSETLGEKILVKGLALLVIFNMVACSCLILFLSTVGRYCFEDASVYVTEGLLYGLLLWSMYDRDREHETFYFIRIALIGSALILTTTAGIGWIILAIIFWSMQFRAVRKGLRYNKAVIYDAELIKGSKVILSWIGIWLSWFIFCIFTGRVTLFANSVDDIAAAKEHNLRYYAGAKIWTYLKGLVLYPLYDGVRWSLDIPLIIIITAIFVALVLLAKKDIITQAMNILLMIYICATGVITYVGIFFLNLTVFTGDLIYSTDAWIIESASKYSVTWVLGTIMFLLLIYIQAGVPDAERLAVADTLVKDQMVANRFRSARCTYAIVAGIILITCDYATCYNGLIGYRRSVVEDILAREHLLDVEEQRFVNVVANTPELSRNRVLYLKDASNARYKDNEYINYKVVPASVAYGYIASDTGEEDIRRLIASSYARYVYVETIEDIEIALSKVIDWEHYREKGNTNLFRVLEDGKLEPYRETIKVK